MALLTTDNDLLLPATGTPPAVITWDVDAGLHGLDTLRASPRTCNYMPPQDVSVDLASWALPPFLFDLIRVVAWAYDFVCLAGATSGHCLPAAGFLKLPTTLTPSFAGILMSLDVGVEDAAFLALLIDLWPNQMLMREPYAFEVAGSLLAPPTLCRRACCWDARFAGILARLAPSPTCFLVMPHGVQCYIFLALSA